MANRIDEITPEMINAYIKQGNQLRADAMHSYFVEIGATVKNAFGRMASAFHIPKTEQL